MPIWMTPRCPRRICAALLALPWWIVGCVEPWPADAPVDTTALHCTAQTTSRLYFGMDSPEGPVSDAAWQDFVDREITPRLPAGFTVFTARGQWRGDDRVIRREDSRVLEVVSEDDAAHRRALAETAVIYKARFRQQSVLVTQSPTRVCG